LGRVERHGRREFWTIAGRQVNEVVRRCLRDQVRTFDSPTTPHLAQRWL
jgi:hypothetical protein